ncbi:MAG: GHKL domain-containing protein [Lachnospiraceae bacterium]|nr:GHKL domain-containing protein [Lachnospiraceae bacterium]
MMETVLIALTNVVTIMCILFLLKYVFGAKMELNLKKMTVIAVVYMVFGIITYSLPWPYVGFLGVIVFLVGVFLITATEKHWQIFLYLIPVLFLYNHWGQYTRVLAWAFGAEWFFYDLRDLWLLLILILWAVQFEKKQLTFSMGFGECVFISFFGIISEFYFNVMNMIDASVKSFGNRLLYSITWVSFVTILEVCIILAIAFRRRNLYNRKVSKVYHHYFYEEYRAASVKNKSKQEMDRLRHDWKNHVNTVQAMWEKGETTKAVEYVAGLAEESKNNTYTILSGNEVADAILNLKYEKAKENGIDFQFRGNLDKLSCLEPMEICVLLGNALDNALEACGKGEAESLIRIAATENTGFLLLTIENTLHEKIVLRDNKPVTTKKNPSEHGFGILGMQHVVHKYQGDLRFEIQDGIFKVQMMLPIGEKKGE